MPTSELTLLLFVAHLAQATYRTALSGFTCLQFATFTSPPAFSTHLVLSQLLA